MVNPSHMENGRIAPSNEVTVTEDKATELERHKVRTGDIVAAR